MTPSLALLVCFLLLFVLFCLDPGKRRGTSVALWVPVVWFFFVGTRLPSQWLIGHIGTAAEAYEDSDPLNRNVFLVLTLVAIGILIVRSFNWGNFLARNTFLIAFLLFALMSVSWSDFPFITFKRWFRDLGAYLVMLVALSDPLPLEGVRTVLRRFAYLTVPLSIVLVKYFPDIGRSYDEWTGTAVAVGAASGKNQLGVACLISGIFFLWDTVTRWPARSERGTKRILFVNFIFIVMTIWLLHYANSATSNVCLAIGSLMILVAATKAVKRRPTLFKVFIPTCFACYVILAYWFNINAYLVGAVGRNPTLTNRTFIWATLFGMKDNPVLGTGYRSFFLGARLRELWLIIPGVMEAHNGYLDLYLNLGIIGLVLFLGFLIASYRMIWDRFRTAPAFASLGLAIWTILLFYNVTEAGFVGGLLWLSLMFIGISLAAIDQHEVEPVATFENVGAAEQFSGIRLKTADLRRPT